MPERHDKIAAVRLVVATVINRHNIVYRRSAIHTNYLRVMASPTRDTGNSESGNWKYWGNNMVLMPEALRSKKDTSHANNLQTTQPHASPGQRFGSVFAFMSASTDR